MCHNDEIKEEYGFQIYVGKDLTVQMKQNIAEYIEKSTIENRNNYGILHLLRSTRKAQYYAKHLNTTIFLTVLIKQTVKS